MTLRSPSRLSAKSAVVSYKTAVARVLHRVPGVTQRAIRASRSRSDLSLPLRSSLPSPSANWSTNGRYRVGAHRGFSDVSTRGANRRREIYLPVYRCCLGIECGDQRAVKAIITIVACSYVAVSEQRAVPQRHARVFLPPARPDLVTPFALLATRHTPLDAICRRCIVVTRGSFRIFTTT